MTKLVLGLWPIAGITTVDVTSSDARQTIAAAIDAGVTWFDTAFSYGYDGESDRWLGQAIAGRRDDFHVMAKVGQRWTADRKRLIDGSPDQLTRDAECSLKRLGVEQFDTLMLHSPDPNVEIERSAEAIDRIRSRGLCRRIGVCNVDPSQLKRFGAAVPCHALQCPLNLLQPQTLDQLIPDAQQRSVEVYCFWTLMKGLLAGSITRDHVFAKGDSRPNYDIFQGAARERAHRLVDGLKIIADRTNRSVAAISIGWVMSQEGVSGALVGARRREQVDDLVAASRLDDETIDEIDRLVDRIG